MTQSEQHQIRFQPTGKRIDLPAGQSLLTAAQTSGVLLKAICGGNGTCGSCRVILASGELSPLTAAERRHLSTEELTAGYRLACQAKPLSDCVIEVPAESVFSRQKLGVSTGQQPVIVEAASEKSSRYGLAVDLGSTKIALYLMDMTTGAMLAQTGVINPQVVFGEDVISRIAYANLSPANSARLSEVVIETLNRAVTAICAQAGIEPQDVIEAVIAGNTAMHHLLLKLPVRQLGAVPYEPALSSALNTSVHELGLTLSAEARVFLPPNIAGFVGGDHVAALTAAEQGSYAKPLVLVDIGTNTEISLMTADSLWSCSTASGPAFEGAHISQGMRAADGAIDKVTIVGDHVQANVIGDVPAAGLCGTGVLSAIAQMQQAGALRENGRFDSSHPLVRSDGKRAWVELVPAEASAHGKAVSITRGDVNDIQLAKAAIRSGIDILLKEAHLQPEGVASWVIAGAFGTWLNLPDAVTIGMLPDVTLERCHQIGNAAGIGAIAMLLAPESRVLAEGLAKHSNYLELTLYPGFSDIYIARMALGKNTLDLGAN